jgi:hypothetical protein
LSLFLPRKWFSMRRELYFACFVLAVLASLFLFAAPCAHSENVRPVLITQSVDESKLVTLGGNTRPEARQSTIAGGWPTVS